MSALEAACGGNAEALPVTLVQLACDMQRDVLIRELAIRALGRAWMDPTVEVETKIAQVLLSAVSDILAPRSVLLQVMRTLADVVVHRGHLADVTDALFRVALDRATDARASVRAVSLQTLASICDDRLCEQAQLQKGFIAFLAHDGDPAVRAAAMEGLLALHHRGCGALPLAIWPVAVEGLDDASEGVSCASLSMLSALATLYGTEVVPGGAGDCDGGRACVVDRVFVLTCNAAMDPRLGVRCRAAALLGSLEGTERNVLLQSLFKKPRGQVDGAPLSLGGFVFFAVSLLLSSHVCFVYILQSGRGS